MSERVNIKELDADVRALVARFEQVTTLGRQEELWMAGYALALGHKLIAFDAKHGPTPEAPPAPDDNPDDDFFLTMPEEHTRIRGPGGLVYCAKIISPTERFRSAHQADEVCVVCEAAQFHCHEPGCEARIDQVVPPPPGWVMSIATWPPPGKSVPIFVFCPVHAIGKAVTS